MISRRQTLAGVVAAAVGGPAIAGTTAAAEDCGGAVFSPGGPDAGHYGAAEGFPVSQPWLEPKYRVGSFSHFDALFTTRRIKRAATPWRFKRAEVDFHYTYRGTRSSLVDYLARNPVTGLLIARDDEILFEHYQYGRTDRDRLASQSMAKSITGMLIGIAIANGAIRSVDDTAETYVPGFRGTEYGKTPIRDLLHMSSGVEFGEEADDERDLDRLWAGLMGSRLGVVGRYLDLAKGTVGSIVQFNRRIAPPGTRFSYASIEADVLGMVLHHAVGKSASDYLQEKLWEPIGAEADASWLVDAQGFEVAHGFFNAVLRDYARFARLLAHDGAWDGKQIIPAQWVIDATSLRPSEAFLAPGKADATFGYGYLLWLLPGARRQFALFGAYGQRICVDPTSRLVMVQTSVDQRTEVWRLWSALVEQFGKG
ncbi:MAG: serine hydrolase [Acetobacteraceae bacterium]|nr:serine hydrolase [Acetobacteraceae bacterium]